MKETFSGITIIRILMILIVVFTCFMCFLIVYSRAFRVKNKIIDIIEQYEGVASEEAIQKINDYTSKIGYPQGDYVINCDSLENYCIVTTHATWEMSVLGTGTIDINGRTKNLKDFKNE